MDQEVDTSDEDYNPEDTLSYDDDSDSSSRASLAISMVTSSGDELAPLPPMVAPQVTFDSALPLKHSYLGDNLVELSGRTLLEEGSIHTLPILVQPNIVLVPGQTLPMTVFAPASILMLRNAVATDRTFGAVCIRYDDEGLADPVVADIGTTAEIYAWHEDRDNPATPEFRIKARGRQRFRVLSLKPGTKPALATVMILRERVLPDLLRSLRPRSVLGSARSSTLARHSAALTAWPAWLHRLYDADDLVARMQRKLKHLHNPDKCLHVPNDPIQLSYWATQSLPLKDDQRLTLLRTDSAVQRLRFELSFIDQCQVLCCIQCSHQIADPKDAFSMSVEGPQGTYVNPGGYVHETMTLHRAIGLMIRSERPSYEYSWFPGYGWTMVECTGCAKHMGWLFTTTQARLHPKSFFGLCRSSLTVRIVPPVVDD